MSWLDIDNRLSNTQSSVIVNLRDKEEIFGNYQDNLAFRIISEEWSISRLSIIYYIYSLEIKWVPVVMDSFKIFTQSKLLNVYFPLLNVNHMQLLCLWK